MQIAVAAAVIIMLFVYRHTWSTKLAFALTGVSIGCIISAAGYRLCGPAIISPRSNSDEFSGFYAKENGTIRIEEAWELDDGTPITVSFDAEQNTLAMPVHSRSLDEQTSGSLLFLVHGDQEDPEDDMLFFVHPAKMTNTLRTALCSDDGVLTITDDLIRIVKHENTEQYGSGRYGLQYGRIYGDQWYVVYTLLPENKEDEVIHYISDRLKITANRPASETSGTS